VNLQADALNMSLVNVNPGDKIKCMAFVMEPQFYCARVNTITSYANTNRDIATVRKTTYNPYEPLVKDKYIHPNTDISTKTTIGPDCVVGEACKMGAGGSVKKSIIGLHCEIGNGVKINNSIILNRCIIQDGSTINNSIICNNVEIQENCQITNCKIGAFYTVAKDSDVKNEILVFEND